MRKLLASFTLFEALFSLVVGGFIVLFFSSMSLKVFEDYMFQKSFQRGNQTLDTLKLQISNHLQDAFIPSIKSSPYKLTWQKDALKYPILLEETSDVHIFTYKGSLPIDDRKSFGAYCVESHFYSPISIHKQQFELKFQIIPPRCKIAYIVAEDLYGLHFDAQNKYLYLGDLRTPHVFEVEDFYFSYQEGVAHLHLCLKDAGFHIFACRYHATSEICTKGQCTQWMVIL